MKYFLYALVATFFGLAIYGFLYSAQTNWMFSVPMIIIALVLVALVRKGDSAQQEAYQPTVSDASPISLWKSPIPYMCVLVVLIIGTALML